MSTRPYRTNPTGLIKIDRRLITITVNRNSASRIDSFSVEKIQISDLSLPFDAPVTLIPYYGFNEMRFELGTIGSIKLLKDVKLGDLEFSGLIFRLLVRESEGYRILASCESIYPSNEDEEDRIPLLYVQYVPLGERLWELQLSGGNRPVLRINDDPALGLRNSFECRDPLIRGLIVPQAFEQSLVYLALNPATSEDPSNWQNVWTKYLEARSIEPFQSDSPHEDIEQVQEWAKQIAGNFASEIRFATKVIAKRGNQKDVQ